MNAYLYSIQWGFKPRLNKVKASGGRHRFSAEIYRAKLDKIWAQYGKAHLIILKREGLLMDNEYKVYHGENIEVKFHSKRCVHAAKCVKGLPEVFDVSKRPWVSPDQALADDVARVIERCPSGALEYVRKDGEAGEQPQAETTLDLQPGHVMYIRGNLTIKNGDETIQLNRAALCGCGHSHNKPFCDNEHECRS